MDKKDVDLDINELTMYFPGYNFKVNKNIEMISPTVGDIIEFGEEKYYSTVHSLSCIPSDMISTLWDMGIDWEELDDFELFIMLSRSIDKEQTKLIFEDLDLSKMQMVVNNETEDICLINEETNQVIDRIAYMKISAYLRKLHNIKPKIKKAKTKTTKKLLIELDRGDKEKALKNNQHKSQLKPLISAMMRYPGFKYKSNELKECTLYEFMDTVQGAAIYISSTSLLQGSYSGFCDTSKINKEAFDWMRESSSE